MNAVLVTLPASDQRLDEIRFGLKDDDIIKNCDAVFTEWLA